MKAADYALADLIDVARLQRTCDGLSAATGMVLALLDPDGTVLVASGWQDICTRFHRAVQGSAAGCLESDRRINERVLAGMEAPEHIAYRCSNGLWDVAFPLILDGRHVATVFTGQFFYDDDEIDAEVFRAQAREHGFDETAYLDALTRVPVLTHEQIEQTMGFLADFVGMLSESGLNALRDREAERRLLESRELLHDVVEHDPSAIAVMDNELRYVFVSQRYLDDYRIDDRDVIGKTHYEVFPDIPERWREIHRRVLGGAVERSDEDAFPRKDGSVDWVRWECRPWFAGDGSVGGMVLYSEHITERREAAEELRRSRERYETFIDATDDMAFLKDEQLRYVLVNTANARFLERSADDIRGHTDDELMPPEAAEKCRASDHRALKAGGVVVTAELIGDRIYESRKFPVDLGDGRVGVGGYVRDVTEQRRVDAEIRRLANDLERRVEQRTEQLEATNRELESFAYSISHDLRAPLRALDGFSEILLQDYNGVLDEEGRGYLRRIKGAANHMAGLMDGLLQLSRLNREELALEQIDLSRLAGDVVDELRRQEPGRRVDVLIEPGLLAEADPRLMRVALANLIGNSWKFTSRHEQARIEVGAAPVTDDHGGVAFYVKDDGAGFDPRYASNLFGAFQRLHTPDQFEGTGIGLATVQRIVHRHGGTVWAEGLVEQGATFWFTLAPHAGERD